MIDVVFAVAFAALLVSTLAIVRSPATTAILVAAGVGLSGVTLQFAAEVGLQVTQPRLQWWLLVTLVAILLAGVLDRRRTQGPQGRTALLLVVGTSGALAFAFLATRFLAPGAPGPLTSVGHLISRTSAEDNAKWLSAAAALASGAPVESWSSVGGPLLLLLTLAATIISAVSDLLYGGVNEVAVAAGAPILSSMILVVLAPFALSPIMEARFRPASGRRGSTIPWPILLLGIAIVVTGVVLLLDYGHLTLQFTILILTLWVGTFLAWRRRAGALLLSTIAVITTAEVWFPLNVVALGLLLGLIALGILGIAKRHRVRDASLLVAGSAVLLVLMWEFLRSSIVFSLGIGEGGVSNVTTSGAGAGRGLATAAVPSLPLFSQPGGTEVVTALLTALTVLSVIGALLLLRDTGGRRYILRFAPIAILSGYVLLVTFADFWAVGKGPGYASNKLTYAIAVPLLAATLPVAMLTLDKGGRGMTALRWFALGGVVALLVIDTFLPRAILQLKPALWPSTSGDPQPYWWPAEVRPTGDQPLTSNPIGCVYLPQGAERPSVVEDGRLAYACTRLLTGIAGQDVPASAVVDWTLSEWLNNSSQWDNYLPYFNQMPQETRNRRLILLDDGDNVVGIESLQTLMDRFPADPITTTP